MTAHVEAFPLYWPVGWERTHGCDRPWSSPFGDHSFYGARQKLLEELRLLRATDCIISSNQAVKLNGQPYADGMRPSDPGVAVYFNRAEKPLVLARDKYPRIVDNLRSVTLAIAALRQLERHGGDLMVERAFSGFLALPAPGGVPHWSEVLGFEPSDTLDAAHIEARFRELARKRHPDIEGGSEERMAELNGARDAALAAVGG